MKSVVISCFDYYATRTKKVCDFFESKGFENTYIYSNFDHFAKKKKDIVREKSIIISVPTYKRNISIKRLFSHYVFAKKVMKILKKEEFDVIYSIIPPNYLVRNISIYKKKNVKTIVYFDCYDLWPESMPSKSIITKIPFYFWASLRDKNIQNSDLIFAVSEHMRSKFTNDGIKKDIKVFYPSIDVTDIPNFKEYNKKIISFLYLGNINFITDIELMINFFKEMNKQTKTCLHIIGSGQFFEQLVTSLENIGTVVYKHGVVFDQSKKKEIMSLCNYGINFPKKEIRSSMSLKSIEYLSNGMPIINSGVGDISRDVDEFAIGFNYKMDDNNTIENIVNTNKSSFEKLKDNCLKYYTIKFSQDLNKLFELDELLKGRQ